MSNTAEGKGVRAMTYTLAQDVAKAYIFHTQGMPPALYGGFGTGMDEYNTYELYIITNATETTLRTESIVAHSFYPFTDILPVINAAYPIHQTEENYK